MNKKIIPILFCGIGLTASAGNLDVNEFCLYGPFPVRLPAIIDSLDVNSRKAELATLFMGDATLNMPSSVPVRFGGEVLPEASTSEVGYLEFNVDNSRFAKAKLNVTGLGNYTVYADGKKLDDFNLSLSPATHRFVVKYLATPEKRDSLKVWFDGDDADRLSINYSGKRMFTLSEVTDGTHLGGATVSADGKYAIVSERTVLPGGETRQESHVVSLPDGKTLFALRGDARWMPKGSRYFYLEQGAAGTCMVVADVATGESAVVASGIPEGYVTVTPDESRLLINTIQVGPKEGNVHQIIEPDDRQPGWRDRYALWEYDIKSGVASPVTHGYHNVMLCDVSPDSRKALVIVPRSRLARRPTTVSSIYEIDLDTREMSPVVEDDGFVSSAKYSPDGELVLVTGYPEALGGVGRNLPKNRIPSMVDTQLFVVSLADGSRRALTREFDPSVQSAVWSRNDNMVYLTAENRDRVSMYRLNPLSGEITMIDVPEDVVSSVSVAEEAPVAVYCAESVSNPARLYRLDLSTLGSSLLAAPRDREFEDVALAECHEWNFRNSRGDSICGRFYLPPNFDPEKKYPLIVNYYGGCSPTSRNFATRYPHHVYASLGYVVYVIQPSGATGFGQEFSSRHVNTAGKGVAEDIIEGTKEFCKTHKYVDDKKIGCIGASYGGFMTQYLQTVTDMFAAAVSHAGISDHTSYWGEGFWGFSYSEVSMAESYPWSDPDLYVKQSPLYNAHKINTPLLFVHGGSDNNVPVGESIQMFNALKLLGKETAFVIADGEDHWIIDYDKRKKWQDTIFAWFAKHLQNDPSWWNTLFPEKNL